MGSAFGLYPSNVCTPNLFSFLYSYFSVKVYRDSGVLISTDDRRKASATLLREVGYFSPRSSLPADVLWSLFLTHSFLPRGPFGRSECVTNKNKPHRTSAGSLHPRGNTSIFEQILSTISLRKCMEISLENLYVDTGA